MLRFTRCIRCAAGTALRYVASDMDESILRDDHCLSEFAKRTLFQLTHERKVPFIFATGRQHADVAVVNDHLQDFFRHGRARCGMAAESADTATPVYLITCNGAVVHNARTNEVVMEHCVPEPLVRELYALLPAAETRVNTHLSRAGRWYCRADWQELLDMHKESGLRYEVLEKIPEATSQDAAVVGAASPVRSPTNPAQATPWDGDVSRTSKVFFTCWDKPLLDQVEALLRQRYGDRLTVTYSAYYTVTVTAKGVNKERALRTVLGLLPPPVYTQGEVSAARQLSAAEERTLDERMKATAAFGNDLNDACMLRSVGRGFLMGNSNPRLVAECPGLEMIDTNNNDGVAKKIRELFQLDDTSTSKPDDHSR